MSLGRWKQWAGEKTGSLQPTQLEGDFTELYRKTDDVDEITKKFLSCTEAVLQPSNSARTKLRSHHLGKGGSQTRYSQPEGELGEAMIRGSTLINTPFGDALQVLGEAEKQIAEARYALDTEVMQSVVKPLMDFREREIKETSAQRKKLESRRLDYDVKKRAGLKKPGDPKVEADFAEAERKFEQSKELVWNGMAKIIDNEPEQCQQLLALAQAQLEFYKAAVACLEPVVTQLESKCEQAGSRASMPRYERKPSRTGSGLAISPLGSMSLGTAGSSAAAGASAAAGGARYVKALFDFTAENPQELTFKQGDQIELLQELDDNWLEGALNGRAGIFPRSYVANA